MKHSGKEAREFFISHLQYLFSLRSSTRGEREDWKAMKSILLREGYWKNLPRGVSDAAHFSGGNDKDKHDAYLENLRDRIMYRD
jgi:hypothetical protein